MIIYILLFLIYIYIYEEYMYGDNTYTCIHRYTYIHIYIYICVLFFCFAHPEYVPPRAMLQSTGLHASVAVYAFLQLSGGRCSSRAARNNDVLNMPIARKQSSCLPRHRPKHFILLYKKKHNSYFIYFVYFTYFVYFYIIFLSI